MAPCRAIRNGNIKLTTPYDRVAYPSSVFIQTHPERLAILMRLAGLTPAEPSRSRILEIGGGDCLNLLSFAAIWPECEAHGFDLSEVAIARGVRFARTAGLENVALVVEDIIKAQQRYPARSFDYVILHGVYAWVPDEVRAACMALIAHVLSDNGVAMVSYNAMPGGHVRLIMREMLMNVIEGIDDFEGRIEATRSFLEDYAKPRDGDDALAKVLREQAGSMLNRPDSVLFHDELGDCYYPQRLIEVAQAGEELGLRLLTDAGRNRHLDGFLKDGADLPEDADKAVLLAASRSDYEALRYFRHSLFVRAEQPIDRVIDAGRIADMYLTTRLQRQEDGTFMQDGDRIEIADDELAAALERAASLAPERVPVSEITRNPEHLRVLLQLFAEWYVTLHPGSQPFPLDPGPHPETSPLVMAMLKMGELTVCTLEHRLLKIEQDELRGLLLAADGTRTVAEIAAMDHGIPSDEVPAALTASARRGLLLH